MWYENTDGLGSFGPPQVISILTDGATSVFAADLDGDGDQDVLSSSDQDDKIAWYENDGLGNFGPQLIITTLADEASWVFATDIDGDGDPDVLSSSRADDKIAWYENETPPQPPLSVTVTVEPKTAAHPLFGQGHPDAFVIDGIEANELTLIRGETYIFEMDNTPNMHPFYISTDDAGGGAGEWTDGVTGSRATGNDALTFVVSSR